MIASKSCKVIGKKTYLPKILDLIPKYWQGFECHHVLQ